jgi:hypothetical protein
MTEGAGGEGETKLSGENIRDQESQRLHDEAVRLIADHRFCVAEWNVSVNPASEQNDGVADGKAAVYPDIVAREGENIVALGEIETTESVSEAEVAQWLELGALCPRMYLFVPEGTEHVVEELIHKHGVHCAGLRTYTLDKNAIRIQSVSMRNGRSKWDNHRWWRNLGRGN